MVVVLRAHAEPHRPTHWQPQHPLTGANAVYLYMKDRPDLHCQLDAAARPACTVPAEVLAAHNYCEAAADHNLPPLTATFASLPPRTPCGAYPVDADVEATFNEAEVDHHLRAIRACAAAGIEGLRNQHVRALAIGEEDDE